MRPGSAYISNRLSLNICLESITRFVCARSVEFYGESRGGTAALLQDNQVAQES